MNSNRIEQFGEEITRTYKEIAAYKWRNDFSCSVCGHKGWFEGKFPYSKRCAKCKKDFSPTAGTIFHGVRFPLHIAIYIIKRAIAEVETERITSERLTEELITKFNQSLRQKTVWAFLIKVYGAMTFPLPNFSGYVTLIRFVQGGRTIIALKGRCQGKELITCSVSHEDHDEVYSNISRSYEAARVKVSAYDAIFNTKLETKNRKRERTTVATLACISNQDTGNYLDKDFALTVYKAIAGVSPNHYQTYLNLLCYQFNGYNYYQLMEILIPKG